MLECGSIAFVINTLQVGGASKMLTYVSNDASEWFGKVYVISLFDNEKTEKLNSSIVQIPLGRCVKRAKDKAALFTKLRRTISKISPAMVCAFVSDVAFYTRIATLGMKTVMISAERGDPYTLPQKWVRRVRWTYSKSDYCVFQTKQGAEFFGDKVIEKSFVIPNPYIPTGSAALADGEKRKTVVSGGRLVAQKGFDILISAFAKVIKKHPEYRLTIYGEGQDREKLEKQVRDLGLESLVDMPGYVDDLQERIYGDGIFVLSSRFEGIPNALIEAMAAGLPCIATDCTPGGPSFLCGDNERGLLIPMEDSDIMAEKILYLIENPSVAEKLGANAKGITETLDKKVITSMWHSMFERISSQKRGSISCK